MDTVLPCFSLRPLEIAGRGFRGIGVFAALHTHLIIAVARTGRQAANATAWISGLGASGIIGFFGLINRGRLRAELKGGGDVQAIALAAPRNREEAVRRGPATVEGKAVREATVEVAGGGGGGKGGGVIGEIAEDATAGAVGEGTRHEAVVSGERPGHEAPFGGEWTGHESTVGSEGTGEWPGEAGDGLEGNGRERGGALEGGGGGAGKLGGEEEERGGERGGWVGAHGGAGDGAEGGGLPGVVDLGGTRASQGEVRADVAERVAKALVARKLRGHRSNMTEAVAGDAGGQLREAVAHGGGRRERRILEIEEG